ncbi:MAG: glycosyltransferase family 9 protein [Kiritimatiellia bacterium]|jgi:ADP-heptose:LPS heptosyltransferase
MKKEAHPAIHLLVSILSRIVAVAMRGVGLARICVRRMARGRKRVMLYKSKFDLLGDMILMTGVVPHYRRLFPDATLEMVCNDVAVDLMQAADVLDAVWPMSRLSRNGRPSWLNAGRSDVFISLRRTVFPPDVKWMSRFMPVKAIGFSGDALLHRIGKLPACRKLLALDCELPDDGGGSALHELDVQRKMLSMLGMDVPVEALRPKIPESYVDHSVARELEKLYDLDGRPFYVCCPCGSQPIRSYPAERWRRVFAGLAPCVVALCATGSDWREMLALMAEPPEGVAFVNLAGQTRLAQLAGLLRRADAVLAVESGPMHMAVALDRPLAAICGRGHYGRFVPYPFAMPNARFLFADCEHSGCDWNCHAETAACISQIDPAEVCDAVKEVVDASPCKALNPES